MTPDKDLTQLTAEALVQLSHEKYAMASRSNGTKEMHKWAMKVKAENLRRLRSQERIEREFKLLIEDADGSGRGYIGIDIIKTILNDVDGKGEG